MSIQKLRRLILMDETGVKLLIFLDVMNSIKRVEQRYCRLYQPRSNFFCNNFRGGSRIFFRRGALVSCSTSTPINHIAFFFGRAPVVLETPCTLPLDPPLQFLMEGIRKRYLFGQKRYIGGKSWILGEGGGSPQKTLLSTLPTRHPGITFSFHRHFRGQEISYSLSTLNNIRNGRFRKIQYLRMQCILLK